MKRRDFLIRTSALAATTALGLRIASSADCNAEHRLKTCLFSGMFKGQPLKTTMEAASAIGFDGIEIAAGYGTDHMDVNCTPERAAEIKAMAAANRLGIALIYTALGGNILQGEKQRAEALEGVERFLTIADQIGTKMIKVGAGRLKNSAFQEDDARIVAGWLGQACDRAAAHGSRVVTEIHFGQYCETSVMARRMIDLVNRPNYGVIHDAGNMHITGDKYGEEAVKLLGDRIFHVHVKDMVQAPADDKIAHDYAAGRFKRAPLNEGNVDHLTLFRALKRIGYNGYLSCEATGGDDPVAVAKHEFVEVQKLLKM
jgi:sugar phosphate isomerase/epimerase